MPETKDFPFHQKVKCKDVEYDLADIIDMKKDIVPFEAETDDGKKEIVGRIISKNGIKKLRDKFNLKVSFLIYDKVNNQVKTVVYPIPELIELAPNEKLIYTFGCIQNQDGTIESVEVGEINTKNLKGISALFPMAILYKRAYGRVILDHLKLYEFYTEEEAEEFKEKISKGMDEDEFNVGKVGEVICSRCEKKIEDDEEKLKAKRRIEIFGEILCDKCVMNYTSKSNEKKEVKEDERKKKD